MNKEQFLKAKSEQQKGYGISRGIFLNSHMNNFHGNASEKECVLILDKFVEGIAAEPASWNLGDVADWLVYNAKNLGSGKSELEKAVIVDFVNTAVHPLDLRLYAEDI